MSLEKICKHNMHDVRANEVNDDKKSKLNDLAIPSCSLNEIASQFSLITVIMYESASIIDSQSQEIYKKNTSIAWIQSFRLKGYNSFRHLGVTLKYWQSQG